MKGLHCEIIVKEKRDDFLLALNDFMFPRDVFSVKLQRNLYYAGIGSSAGRTPGVTVTCPPAENAPVA